VRDGGTTVVEQELVEAPAVVELPVSRRHRNVTGSVLVVLGLLTALALGLGSKAGVDAKFNIASATDYVKIPTISLPARAVAVAIGLLIVVLGVIQIARGFSRRAMAWVIAVTIVGVVFAFLCWASTGQGNAIDLLSLFQQTVILAVPLILGAMAGILGERSGVVNVAIEGQMLTGAFAGALVATLAKNDGVGIVGAMVAGGLIGALLAVFAIKYLVNQVILGVVLNLLALGLTGFVYDALMAPHQEQYNNSPPMNAIAIPVLSKLPLVGSLLFDQNIIVYMMYAIVIVIEIALFRTRWGLRTRAVGEHPLAADTVGVKVRRTRYRNVILGGLVAGLAGAFLTVGQDVTFTKNITSGKGFIALAAVIFGRWSPRGAVGAALLFGFCDALQTVLSFIGTPVTIPSSLLAMLPYLATIFAVAGLVGRVRAPAADGVPYTGR
jgi:general nucleoside transport system permease protein